MRSYTRHVVLLTKFEFRAKMLSLHEIKTKSTREYSKFEIFKQARNSELKISDFSQFFIFLINCQ